MIDPLIRFNQARKLGRLALLRLRAECLLTRIDEAPVAIAAEDLPGIREKLDRIASVPRYEDADFLESLDFIYEQDEKDEEANE